MLYFDYMLRFTQEHACLPIRTQAVDMPADIPQTQHTVANFRWIAYVSN